jgi:hypothetical protein
MRFVPKDISTVKVDPKSRSFAALRMTNLLFSATCTINPISQMLQAAGFGIKEKAVVRRSCASTACSY